MISRVRILCTVLLAVYSVVVVRAARPGDPPSPSYPSNPTDAPQTAHREAPVSALAVPDSLSMRAEERTQRLYDSIQSKTSRRRVPRLLYDLVFIRPMRDTTASGRVVDESQPLERYADRTIGEITIDRQKVFEEGGNWFERAGNNLHVVTGERVIRRDLLFKPGQRLDPQSIVRSKQLLRSRSYISDADIIVTPDPEDSMRVNLLVRTRDSWTISIDAALHSGNRTMISISDNNIVGTGNRLKIKTNFDRGDFSYGGNMIEYGIPNVLGTFYTFDFIGGHDFLNETLSFSLSKDFYSPRDYAVGLSYSDIRSGNDMALGDSSPMVKNRNLDLWGGRSFSLRSIRSSIYGMARYNYSRFSERPWVAPDFNPALHDRDMLLASAGLYREKFYSANMVYGFGVREYVATGYKAELVSGYSWGEFHDQMYLGLSYRRGGFHSWGYLMGGITLGSYIDLKSGKWRQSAVDVDLAWFSNLIAWRRNRIRQFLSFNYTQGWNRGTGSYEEIQFTSANGPQALSVEKTGINRMVANTETVLFTPFQPWGFRFAFFAFGDVGLLGYSPNIFKNNAFTSFGLGVRIKNERLIFNTIQIRIGIAFGKGGLVGSDYFNISNTTYLEQFRYRPMRPEIVGFQ